MRSSSGSHYIALDHIRALAAFMVFSWHFTHAANGYPIPFDDIPIFFPFALLDEGHTGVALFMALSGYLFAKLLDGKRINYMTFLINRALRLFPLLAIIILIVGIKKLADGESLAAYSHSILTGAILPTLPNGGWSITVEFHYYLIIPLLLLMLRKSKLLPVSIILIAIAVRSFLYSENGEVQSLAYWTIIGRIDQFTLGMIIYGYRTYLANRHTIAISTFVLFSAIYWVFDLHGGFYQLPSYPSPNAIWVILPTIEGLAYAVLIAWYDNSFSPSASGISKVVGHIGEYSYSIYLMHFFIVFEAAKFANEHIIGIHNFYLACFWSAVFFLLMVPAGYLSFRFIEAPFLRLRKRYTSPRYIDHGISIVPARQM